MQVPGNPRQGFLEDVPDSAGDFARAAPYPESSDRHVAAW